MIIVLRPYTWYPNQRPAAAHHAQHSRYAILGMTTGRTTYDFESFSNKHTYASKHGYDLIWDFEVSRRYAKVWDKLNITRDAIRASLHGDKAYEWVWMLDFDTLITNMSIPLSDVIDQALATGSGHRNDINLILTRDCEALNAGSMFLRVHPWTLDFIEQWRAGAEILDSRGDLRNEQIVLRDMLLSNDFRVADRSLIAPQWMFDAYPEELKCHDPRDPRPWKPGMFLLHFAGVNWHLKGQQDALGSLVRKYFPLVV